MDQVFESEQARTYEAWLETPAGQSYQRASCALLDRVLDCRRDWRVLDVGCGAGVHLAHLGQFGVQLHGLEQGPVMARIAGQALGHRAEIDLGDAQDLPYEDNSFDAVILINTLELVDRPGQALAEAARVATSRVCMVALNPWSLGGLMCRWAGAEHPLRCRRPLALWSLIRLVRQVLGPVPLKWAGSTFWPGWRPRTGWRPLGGLVAVSAAVTPRFATRPLPLEEPSRSRAAQPVHSAGRVTLLHRIK